MYHSKYYDKLLSKYYGLVKNYGKLTMVHYGEYYLLVFYSVSGYKSSIGGFFWKATARYWRLGPGTGSYRAGYWRLGPGTGSRGRVLEARARYWRL